MAASSARRTRQETRKLAAVLVTDVVGYSRLVRPDEDRILVRLRALCGDLIDSTTAVYHGRIFKRTGDGSRIEFRSVVDALRCAIQGHNGLHRPRRLRPASERRTRQVVEDGQIPRRNRAKSSVCRYCGQEIRYERPNSAIFPLPLGTATAAH